MSCPDCEHHRLSAAMWRNEAYKHAGTPLPWNPEELLRKEYERGRAAGAAEEREACAKVCEAYTDNDGGKFTDHEGHGYEIAAAIRARGEMK